MSMISMNSAKFLRVIYVTMLAIVLLGDVYLGLN